MRRDGKSGQPQGNKETPGAGESGSSGTDGPGAASAPALQQARLWAVARTAVLTPDEQGNVTLDSNTVQAALEAVKKDPGQRGRTANNITVSARTLDLLLKEKVVRPDLTADGIISICFGRDTLKLMDPESAEDDVVLGITEIKGLIGKASAAVGARPAFSIGLNRIRNGRKGSALSLNGNTATVKLFYPPAENETAGGLYAVSVQNLRKVDWLTRSSYDPGQGAVVFEENHFGVYGVGYQPVTAYGDVEGHRAKDDIDFAVGRGLIAGISPEAAGDSLRGCGQDRRQL